MNNDDWAISVGIGHFSVDSGLESLPGAVADAERFNEWLGNQEGGGIPESQRHLLVSRPEHPESPRPTTEVVVDALRQLYETGMSNRAAGNGFRLGRRLWLYFSGHGVSLNGERTTDTGILTADAKPRIQIFSHLNAQVFADFFRDAPGFEQVILIMDCCRSSLKRITPQPLIWPRMVGEPQASTFYAFAVANGLAAREVETTTGPAGLFSTRMLEVLNCPRETPLTARELGEILDSAFDAPQRPDIYPPRLARLDFPIIGPSEPVSRRGADHQEDQGRRLVIVDEHSPESVLLANEFANDSTMEAVVLDHLEAEARPRSSLQGMEQVVFAHGRPNREMIERIIASVRPKSTLVVSDDSSPVDFNAEQMTTQSCTRPSLEVARANARYQAGGASAGCDLRVQGNPLARLELRGEDGRLLAEDFGNLKIQDLPYGRYRLRSELAGQRLERESIIDQPQLTIEMPHLLSDGPFFQGLRLMESASGNTAVISPPAPLMVARTGNRDMVISVADDRRSETLQSDTYCDSSNGVVETWRSVSGGVVTRVLVTYAIGVSLSATVSVPIVAGWRTEVYLHNEEETGITNLAVRMAQAELPIGASLPTDSLREAIRAVFSNHGAIPNVTLDVNELQDDPIAILLAIGLGIANDREPSFELLELANNIFGSGTCDAALLQQPSIHWSAPLLSTTWFHALAKNRITVERDSPSEHLAGRLLATEPWLTWDQAEEFNASHWLSDVAEQVWPGWKSDADASRVRHVTEIQSAMGASADFIKRTSYKAPPVECLVKHNKIAFVGATNDQLLQALAIAFAFRERTKWTDLAIWFLTDDQLSRMKSAGRDGEKLLQNRNETEGRFSDLLPQIAEHFSIKRYDAFKIKGQWHFASLWDWEQPGGFIHLSRYTAGTDVRTAESTNLIWTNDAPPSNEYVEAIHSYKAILNVQ